MIRRELLMLDDQRPGAVHWIDHYAVPTTDPIKWADFYARVLGAQGRGDEDEAPQPGGRLLFTDVGNCHVGGSGTASLASGSGLPGYGWFIRPEQIEEHMRRLDANGVGHSAPTRTAENGEEGAAIRFADPDGNKLEFWAP